MRDTVHPFIRSMALWATLWMSAGIACAHSEIRSLFEARTDDVPATRIDRFVTRGLDKKGMELAPLCSDEVFVRRVFLDVIGTLPSAEETESFLKDTQADKRSLLIDRLFDRPEFIDTWSLKWGDILRVKAEFPINLWPNAVQCYARWIHDSVRENKPYDQFARELLTSNGSNFRVGPVNFYRALQGREASAIASAVALTFMGTRLEKWPEDQRAGLQAFFSRVAYKPTAEWKEEIVCLDPAATEPVEARFPDGSKVVIPVGEDPRKVFADWLIKKRNPWFARAVVNRQWSWLMGRGLIHEPDDILPESEASHPKVLAYLEKELVESHYDLRHVFRLILNSRVYQQSSIPQSQDPDAEALFACYPVRRLDAEVLIDALHQIYGGQEEYSSLIPEPFTFIPEEHRTIQLSDGSITSSFLEMFGRPARDTGLESERNNDPTNGQRLHLLNATEIRNMIGTSPVWDRLMQSAGKDRRELLRLVYMTLLSRAPTSEEEEAVAAYVRSGGVYSKEGLKDIAWAITNTKEFLYRH